MSKERIVKFSGGTYGIQAKGAWFSPPEFLWLRDPSCQSPVDESYFKKYCRSENLVGVKALFDARREDEKVLTFAPLKTDLADHM